MEYNKFDKRLVERNIESGLITKEEYEAYLEALPDVEDKAEVLSIQSPNQDSSEEASEE